MRNHPRQTIDFVLFASLFAWAALVVLAAASGATAALTPIMIVVLVAAGVVVPTTAYAFSSPLRARIEAFGLRRLTLFHAWRIIAALLFFHYGAAGELPATFVRHAAWGDLIAGLAALAVTALPMARGRYYAMHAFGMADFLLAVGTGLYFTLTAPQDMAAIRDLPLALIPLFGVGLSGATHLIAFDLLRRRAGGSEAAIRPAGLA